MAKLFVKQAKQYAEGRPTYPQELFKFIAKHTPSHHLAWDVGTGTGQAALSLASIYKNVVATDTSPNQLELAAKHPNITYQHTSAAVSMEELQTKIGSQSTFDLVTVAQAMHWLDLPTFYHRVKWILKKPDGVIAAWCYTTPEINAAVDAAFQRFYTVDSRPYWDSARKLVDEKYETIDFPFEPVSGLEHTGPFRFSTEKSMDLEGFLTYLRSWSAYQTAKEAGVELLTEDVVEGLSKAWLEDGITQKSVVYPVYLRIGKVRVVIKGRVQGVFYRNWTIENAKELGLKGWVRWKPSSPVARRWSNAAMVTGLQVFPSTDDPGTTFDRKPTV